MLTRDQKFLIANLALVQFNHIVDFMILMPLGDQLMQLFEITPQQFSLLVASYTFFASISSLLAALFVDRFDRKSILLIFFVGFTVGTLACAMAPSYEFLLIARSLAGFFGGVLSSLVLSIISDSIPYSKRGTAMGLLMTAFSFASIAGVPFSLYIAHRYSWNAPFFFLGGLCLVNLFMIWMRIPSMKDHIKKEFPKNPLAPILGHLSSWQSLTPLFFSFFLVMGQFAVISFLTPTLISNVGMTQAQVPLIYLVGGLVSLMTGPLIGYLSDRMGKHLIFTVANVACLVPLVWLTQVKSPQPLHITLFVVALFFIFVGGRMNPAMAMVSASVEPARRGSFMSLVSSAQQMASALASSVAGYIVVRTSDGKLDHFETVGYVAVILSLLSLYLSRKLKPNENATASPTPIEVPNAHV
jgi:DHA1 family inner membrane transport protein